MPASGKRDVDLFTEAIQLPLAERTAFLNRECAEDEDLRRKIDALLRFNDSAGDFLESPPTGSIQHVRAKVSAGEKPGDRVDRYKLVRQIGEGGCGIVFMAEQESPVRRRVALKIIKPGMDTKSVVARFEAERQALALMDHPNIAKIFDAGTTESGRPYFVMELVDGIKITEYADQKLLTTEDRLRLFGQVCQAVQHAHQKGIIHRDIKPSNILVTTTGQGAALPVVIDFGIAKATTNQPLTDKTLFTAVEMIIGTPAYMSPEQATLASADVDTRTDIYSLGVLLYELLTGSTPFDTDYLLKAGLDDIRRVIREQDPIRPSTRLSKLTNADLTSVARRRQSEPPTLVREVRGDLDWIVMKALEKDRARRYATANGLALDIQRFLAHESISARPPSKLYRLQKAAERNKLLFAGIGVIAVLLLSSLIVVSVLLAQERRSLRKAEAASTKSQQRRKLYGPEHPSIAGALHDLAWTVNATKKFEEAESLEAESVLMREKLLGDSHPDVGVTLNSLGKLLGNHGDKQGSEAVLKAVLSIQRKMLVEDHPATLETLDSLAQVLQEEGKRPEAESTWREALAIWHKRGEDDKPERLYALRGLGESLESQAKWPEAQEVWRESLVLWRQRGGIEERQSMFTLRKLGLALEAARNWPEAESVYHEALNISRQKGEDDPEVFADLEKLLRVLTAEKRLVEAQHLLDPVLTPSAAKPASVNLRILRVNVMGRRGRWQDAVADATLALQNQPTEHYRYHTLAALLAVIGDRSGYEQVCKRLVTKFGDSTDPYVAERIVQDCLLLPNSGADLPLLDKLADKAITAGRGTDGLPYFQACKAMSDYRLGDFPEAIVWGEKAANSSADFARAKALAVLAMAHWQLGQSDEARACLAKGEALAPRLSPETGVEDLGDSWVAWLMARISLDEAAKLIQELDKNSQE